LIQLLLPLISSSLALSTQMEKLSGLTPLPHQKMANESQKHQGKLKQRTLILFM
jgi:hypothetical protein